MPIRFLKQFIYGAIFVLIILGLVFWIYKSFYSKPSCFDNKQNQGELGIDCGGPCSQICLPSNLRNIEIDLTKFTILNDKIILFAKIKNPNSGFAVNNFDYQFNIFDQNKNIIKTINGNSFIYSEQIKYLVEFLNYKEAPNINSVDLKILNYSWTKGDNFRRPILNILDKNLVEKNNNLYIVGKIINNDFAVFNNINIIVNFYDKGIWIGSSKTVIDNISPKEIKEFNVIFPKQQNINNLDFEIIVDSKRK